MSKLKLQDIVFLICLFIVIAMIWIGCLSPNEGIKHATFNTALIFGVIGFCAAMTASSDYYK